MPMSLLINKSISSHINKNFDGIMVFCQAFHIRLFTDEGYEWYILDYDRDSNIAIGMVNQNDPKNATISKINVETLDALPGIKIDYDYIPEQMNSLYNRMRSR